MMILFLIWGGLAWSAEPLQIQSNDIKALVETRNNRVAGKQMGAQAMEHREGYWKRSFLPSVTLRGAQERFRLGNFAARTQPDYGAEVSVNLFNGTKDRLNDALIRRKSERLEAETKVTLYQEIVRAKEIYWNLVFLRERMTLLSSAIQSNKKSLQSAMNRVRGGVATRADQYEFEMKAVELDREMKQSEMQTQILRRELLTVLGYDEATAIDFKEGLQHQHETQSVISHSESQHAFLARPALLQSGENEISAKIVSRNWWPKVDAFFAQNQYNTRNGNVFDAQEGRESVVGLRMTMNLFDYFHGSREAAALRKESQASQSEARYLEREIENEAHSEIETLEFLHTQVHEAEENIRRADKYFQLTMTEYSRGVKNSPDVLGATDKLLYMKTKYFEILRDFQITRDHLLSKNNI